MRKLFRVLWVCRASAASVALGLVFACLTQVHDLYLDIEGVGAPAPLLNPWVDLWPPLRDGLLFGAIVTVFWAMPVHAVARLAVADPAWLGSPYQPILFRDIDGAAGRFDKLTRGVPRLLGLLCYVAAIAGAVYAWIDLPIETGTALADRVRNKLAADGVGLLVCGLLFAIYIFLRRRIYFAIAGGREPAARMARIGGRDDTGAIRRGFDAFVSTVIFLGLVAILLYPPALKFFPRLWLVPLLLGAWTPLLGFIARWTYRARAPLGIVALVAMVVLTFVNGDNHISDLISQPPAPRPSFPEALQRWKAANCDGEACPSPILVLVTGGASRSAFFADSVLGLLTDASCAKPGGAAGACGQEPLFAQRLFAISSVSGGSVGAAVYARALMDGHRAGGYAPPCQPGRRSKLYFKDGTPEDWRACLQKIVAEDFLSPVIAGLGFRDVFSFVGEKWGREYWPDRGRRIEQAFACAYALYVAKDVTDCKPASKWGLEAPLSSLSLGADWSPILLLNSTSSESGKRFLFSGLAPAATEGGRWLQDAYDFYETMPGQDISLVAAAHDSARFPVISPAGALLGDDNAIKTRLVDGGYFENYGASTAYDLALALKEVGLDPFVLLIANDPEIPDSAGWESGDGDGRPLLAPVKPSLIPPLVAAPIGATLATREARGEDALTELQRLLSKPAAKGQPNARSCLASTGANAAPCFALVAVRKPEAAATESGRSVKARIEGVSMSWWLSKPVQKYLDNQLELPRATSEGESAQRLLSSTGQNANIVQLRRVCDALAADAVTTGCRALLDTLAHN